MDYGNKISQYRERLDKTLTSPNLTSEKAIKSLIKKQLFHSAKHENEGEIESILETKTQEVSNTLDMLRSASGNVYESSEGGHDGSHTQWKVSEASVSRTRSTIIVPAGNARDEGWEAFKNILAEINEVVELDVVSR